MAEFSTVLGTANFDQRRITVITSRIRGRLDKLFVRNPQQYVLEWLGRIAIIAVIVMNAVIGFFMEYQAQRSMEELKKLTIVPARVLREGKLSEVPSEELVPGDIIFIEGGDMVTADARVIKSTQLQTDESALSTESSDIFLLNDKS